MENRDPDLVNPGWERPANWNYPEDWDSPAWRRRMRETFARAAEMAAKWGFVVCPKCQVAHTTHTLTCRKCNHRAEIGQKE